MPKDGNQTSTCPMWPHLPHQCTTILAVKYTFSSISLIACIVVIGLIWLFRYYKNGVQRLMLFLTISACIQSLSFMIGDYHTGNNACRFQGFLIQYFSWSTLLWVCAISVHIILIIHDASPRRFEKWFHLLCWLVSLVFACIPFGGDKYGHSGAWCWIKHNENALRFGTWYVPKFLIILLLIATYVYLLVIVLQRKYQWSGMYDPEEEHNKNMLVNEVKPLVAFPLIYVILSIPSVIYRIDDAVNPHAEANYGLSILMVITSPSVGALNAVAFALYSGIQNHLSWIQIKFHFLSYFGNSAGIVHNVNVDDNPIVDGELEIEDEWGLTVTM